MRTEKIILVFFILLSAGLNAHSNDSNFGLVNKLDQLEIQDKVICPIGLKNTFLARINQNERRKQLIIKEKPNTTLFDLDYSVNLNSPSKRRNHEWETESMDAKAEMAEIAEVSDLNIKYKSTITKIREAEEKLNIIDETAQFAWIEKISANDYMEIFISGGGFKNGIDAKLNDRIMINNAGYIESYYESELGGAKTTSKTVKKEELLGLVKWIAEKGFFSFEKEYTCDDENTECTNRMNRNPQPIPLKIVVAVGERRNVVVLPIYAPNIEKKYIDYPKELIQIVEAIYLFASL
jgi:hypothetical protein